MQNKLVSIIIPIYNQEKYLDISIPSALNQTYGNIEIICVNDGSSDNSENIIKKYMEHDSRIKLYNKKNGGLIDAVYYGVKYANGEYIAFLDSDDYLKNDYIKTMIDNIGNYDFLALGYYTDKNGELKSYDINPQASYDIDKFEELKENFIWDTNNCCLSKAILNSRWNKLYKKECLLKVVEEYKNFKSIAFGEDTIFTCLLLKYANSGKSISGKEGYCYNIGNQTSMMSNETINKHIKKSRDAYATLKTIVDQNYQCEVQTYIFYLLLVESLFQRLLYDKSKKQFRILYKKLKKDEIYQKALELLIKYSKGTTKITYWCRKYIFSPNVYLIFQSIKKIVKHKS